MATVARQESENLRMKGRQANARTTRIPSRISTRIPTRIRPSQASRASQALSNIGNMSKAGGGDDGHGQVSVKGRERELKGREKKTQVDMEGREKVETLRGERETQGRECRDLQGRGKKEVEMEMMMCGRARESARPPDTTLLRTVKLTRAVVLTEDSPKQILAEKRVICIVKKETSFAGRQEITGHTQLVESSEATTSDLAFQLKPDIDLTDDPAMCGEYSMEIYQYQLCLENEDHYTVQACFLDHQAFTASHRQTLVNWLIQVHHQFQLLHETLFLTVDILDRYLQVCA